MVECYGLAPLVARGAQVVPFLVRTAKMTLAARSHRLISYSEGATAESRAGES